MARLRLSFIKQYLENVSDQYKTRILSTLISRDSDTEPKESIIIRKFNDLNDWYIKLTGLDEIKRLQDKVILTQESLEKAQQERRDVGKLIVEIRKKSTDLQEQLLKVKRWDDVNRFLDLTREETELIKEERALAARFEILDKTEREIFTTLSNVVRDSHEKEKSQSEYTKYWGIILSIVGTIVGAVISTLISTIRNYQIVNGINKGVEEKFLKISGQVEEAKQSKQGYLETFISQIQNNNQNSTKPLVSKLNENRQYLVDNQKQLTNIYKTVLPILENVNENRKQMEIVLENLNTRYLLSANSVKNGDQFLNLGSFLTAQNLVLQEHQNEIRNILLYKDQNEGNGTGYVVVGVVILVVFVLLGAVAR